MKHKLKVGILFFSILFWTLIGHAGLRDSCASRFQRLSIGKSIEGLLERFHLRKSSPPLKKKEKSVNNPTSLMNGGYLVNGRASSTAQTSKESQLEQKPVDVEAVFRLTEQNAQGIAELKEQSARTDQLIAKNAQGIAELKEQSARTDQLIAKNALAIAELKEQSAKTDQQIAKNTQGIAELKEQTARTDQQIAKTDQIIANFYKEFGHLHNRWGFFVEMLFGDIDLLFKEIGTNIPDIRSRLTRQNDDGITKEFDIVGIGEKYIVLVETKSSLKTSDIVKFLETLKIARSFFPEYPGRKIIGAMGFVFSVESDRKFATSQGLVLIRPKKNSAFIINSAGFHPKEFN